MSGEERHVSCGQTVTAIRLMGAGQGCKKMLSLVKNRHQDRVIGVMGVTVIRRIIQITVTGTNIIEKVRHGFGNQAGAGQMDGQSLSQTDQSGLTVGNAA